MSDVPSAMRPVSVILAAVEVLDLAQLHVVNAREATQDAQYELHDFHQARAAQLFRAAQKTAPDLAARPEWDELRQLL